MKYFIVVILAVIPIPILVYVIVKKVCDWIDKLWNIHLYKSLAYLVSINVGRVEEISFTGDKNCKYQEKKEEWKQERIRVWRY